MLIPFMVTPMSAASVRACFAAAWRARFRSEPSAASLLVLMAQSALETASWRRMMCFNFGNVKASVSGGAPYCIFRTWEVENGVSVPQDAPFRAFEDADAGAAFFLAFLSTHEPDAWPAVLAGDPLAFAAGLKKDGYFTADATAYARGLERIVKELTPPAPPTPGQPTIFYTLAGLAGLGFDDVASFQTAKGLPATGVVDDLTLRAYYDALGAANRA